MRPRLGWKQWAGVVLFFGIVGVVGADDELLRKALDQISGSYAEAKFQLRDREAAVRALATSVAIARTESELFQHLWSEAQVRAQTFGANLLESDAAATRRQLVEVLQKLYFAEADRLRLVALLNRLVGDIDSNQDVLGDITVARELLAARSARVNDVVASSLAAAHVLEINEKLQMVVLDVGGNQGARVGMPLIILRGNRMVAELRVVEVRPTISGALIEKVEHNVTIKAGDTARVTKG